MLIFGIKYCESTMTITLGKGFKIILKLLITDLFLLVEISSNDEALKLYEKVLTKLTLKSKAVLIERELFMLTEVTSLKSELLTIFLKEFILALVARLIVLCKKEMYFSLIRWKPSLLESDSK